MATTILPLEALAIRLALPAKYLRDLAGTGRIPYLDVSGRMRFDEEAVIAALRTIADQQAASHQSNPGGRCMGTAPDAQKQKELLMNANLTDTLIEFACLERAHASYRLEGAAWARLNLRAMGVEVRQQQIPKKGQRGQRCATFATWLEARSRGDAKGMAAAGKQLKGLGVIVEDLAAGRPAQASRTPQAGRTMARQGSVPQPDGAGMSSKPRRIAPPGRTR